MSQTRIAIVGTGAIGCAVGAALGDAGHVPHLAARTPIERIHRTLEGVSREYRFPSFANQQDVTPQDWVMLCTKAYQTEQARAWFDPMIGDKTVIAVLQNGVDQVERLSAYLPANRILPVVVHMAAERDAPGEIVQTPHGRLLVPQGENGNAFAALFKGTEALTVEPQVDFVSALWRKLTLNATTGAVCALTIRQNEVFGTELVNQAARALMAEVMAVGRAEGAQFEDDFISQGLELLSGPVR
ncbi:MAG: 2-dehydropantoate 2-reductase, partial [Gammaproteobacteria bacterium]